MDRDTDQTQASERAYVGWVGDSRKGQWQAAQGFVMILVNQRE